MTSVLRILSVGSTDLPSPAVLLVGPTGRKILVNCGDGCQRAFLEYKQSIKSVTSIALCSLTANFIGGLPGFILTSADTNIAAMNAALEYRANSQKGNQQSQHNTNSHKIATPNLNVIGPIGTTGAINSLRSFMNRGVEKVPLNIYENSSKIIKLEKKNKGNSRMNGSDFMIRSIPIDLDKINDKSENPETKDNSPVFKRMRVMNDDNKLYYRGQIMSYIFTTPPIPGKFDVEKAKKLGIPKGPLYGKLQKGQTISFKHSTSQQDIEVRPDEVVGKSIPGINVSIIYCPTDFAFQQLESHPDLSKFQTDNSSQNCKDESQLFEVMIHITPSELCKSESYMKWMKRFGSCVEHVILNSGNEFPGSSIENISIDQSPFREYQLDCLARHLISREIFPVPKSWDTEDCRDILSSLSSRSSKERAYQKLEIERSCKDNLKIILGRNMLEYTMIPRIKRGFKNVACREKINVQDIDLIIDDMKKSDSFPCNSDIMHSTTQDDNRVMIFTGTGSAIPSKTRNVSGIYLTCKSNENKDDSVGLLFDPGEGTIGNLIRIWQGEDNKIDVAKKIPNIKLIWISHGHADHHLGVLRLLFIRSMLMKKGEASSEKIVIIASDPVFDFLERYTNAYANELKDTYHAIPAYYFQSNPNNSKPLHEKVSGTMYNHLSKNLGISDINCVPVNHCAHAFAVVMDLPTSWGNVAYSGDCRPSKRFAEMAENCDVLIHEATFDSELKEDAILKKHCTVNEAIDIGKMMRAKHIVLTHFSQRYPNLQDSSSISKVDDKEDIPVVFAFDGMVLRPKNIAKAVEIKDCMRKFYSNKSQVEHEEQQLAKSTKSRSLLSSKEILNTPGLFAVKGII